jgi:hypothetical protein
VSSSYSYDSNSQTLTVEGFVRGNGALSANDLVHIPQGGTFKLASVTSVSKARKNAPPPVPVTSDPSSQQPLDMFASPDMLDGEQNLVGFDGDDQLSDYEDMEDATPAAARPAGWSDYQNAWLEDADQDEVRMDKNIDFGRRSHLCYFPTNSTPWQLASLFAARQCGGRGRF